MVISVEGPFKWIAYKVIEIKIFVQTLLNELYFRWRFWNETCHQDIIMGCIHERMKTIHGNFQIF